MAYRDSAKPRKSLIASALQLANAAARRSFFLLYAIEAINKENKRTHRCDEPPCSARR